jgi:hypothetical protein
MEDDAKRWRKKAREAELTACKLPSCDQCPYKFSVELRLLEKEVFRKLQAIRGVNDGPSGTLNKTKFFKNDQMFSIFVQASKTESE